MREQKGGVDAGPDIPTRASQFSGTSAVAHLNRLLKKMLMYIAGTQKKDWDYFTELAREWHS